MSRIDEDARDTVSPEARLEQVYERYLDRLDDFVRAYWLLRIVNLEGLPEKLRGRHRSRVAHATEVAITMRDIGRTYRDTLAPRTAAFLEELLRPTPRRTSR